MRCDAEEPTGRYAAYTERTITVETGLAIALGDEAARANDPGQPLTGGALIRG